jgi:peptide deformylase
MSRLKLISGPDERLTIPTIQVTEFNKSLKDELYEMVHIQEKEKGVGLAAPQVGLNKSMFVVDIPYMGVLDGRFFKDTIKRIIINPILTLSGDDISIAEGCLSFKGKLVKAPRKQKCKVTYQNIFGESVEEDFSGLVAIVFQHEYDHLLGKTLLDYGLKL